MTCCPSTEATKASCSTNQMVTGSRSTRKHEETTSTPVCFAVSLHDEAFRHQVTTKRETFEYSYIQGHTTFEAQSPSSCAPCITYQQGLHTNKVRELEHRSKTVGPRSALTSYALFCKHQSASTILSVAAHGAIWRRHWARRRRHPAQGAPASRSACERSLCW